MPGHNPHRPEGKADEAEAQHAQRLRMRMDAERRLPSEKELKEGPLPEGSRHEAEEQIGGSRPGVPSRVKQAIEDRKD